MSTAVEDPPVEPEPGARPALAIKGGWNISDLEFRGWVLRFVHEWHHPERDDDRDDDTASDTVEVLSLAVAGSARGEDVPRPVDPVADGFLAPDGLVMRVKQYTRVMDTFTLDPLRKKRVGSVSLTQRRAAILADAFTRFAKHGVLQPPTTVRTIRGMTAAQIEAEGIVYVGRRVSTRDGLGKLDGSIPGHPLANPFKLAKNAGLAKRAECVALYRTWLHEDGERLAAARKLRGQILGCWCGDFDGIGHPGFDCHALVIAQVAEA